MFRLYYIYYIKKVLTKKSFRNEVMENFEMPEKITIFDSRMKMIVSHYYCQDERTRAYNYHCLIKACCSTAMKEKFRRYWKTMPIRIAKKSAKQNDENEQLKSTQKHKHTEKKASEIFTIKSDRIDLSANIKIIGKIDLPTTNKAIVESSEQKKKLEEYNKYITKYGSLFKKTIFKRIKNELEHVRTKAKVEQLFDLYCYQYDNVKLAHFLLAYYNPKLIFDKEKMQDEVNILIERRNINRIKIQQKKSQLGKVNQTNNGTTASSKKQVMQNRPQLIYVPWNTIEFCDGKVLFYAFRLNGELILKERAPFVFICKESKSIYNHIRKHIANAIPLIRAYQNGADIVGIESEIHILNAIRLLQTKEDFVEWDSDDSDIKFTLSLENSIKQDYDKILANLRLRKSTYFDYLSQAQCKDVNPVPCKETVIHSHVIEEDEDAFIFSIKSQYKDRLKLVFENVNEARATIVFEIMIDMYEKALRCIFDFMRSNEQNKRQRLHYKKFKFQNHGIINYYFINHTTLSDWKCNLNHK